MKDQHPTFQPLYPALLLIAGPFQAPVHRNDLCHGESLRLDDPLGLGSLLARVQLGDPDAEGPVRTPEPFEGRVG